jgi:hypothetical protein
MVEDMGSSTVALYSQYAASIVVVWLLRLWLGALEAETKATDQVLYG